MKRDSGDGVRLYRVSEAAERLGLSASHVYKLIEGGRMPCVRLGRAVRVSAPQLAEYVRQRQASAVGPRRGRS